MKVKKMRKKSELKMKCFKLSEADYEIILANARKHEKGNFSEWIRRAGKEYIPVKAGSDDDFF